MSETLVHYICRLPKEDDCIKFGSYSVIAKEAFKNSTVENILLSKARVIEQSAFENCKEFRFVTWENNLICDNKDKDKELICINDGSKNKLQLIPKPENDSGKEDEIIKSISEIKEKILIQNSAFKGCDKLETVIFPKNKCIIEKDAFAHCKSLRTVVLPGGSTEIYDDPFIGCKDLTIVCAKGKDKDNNNNKLCAFARAHNFRIIEID